MNDEIDGTEEVTERDGENPDDTKQYQPDILEQVRAKAREIGRMPDMGTEEDAAQGEPHVIRVRADTIPKNLAFHIVNTLKDPRSGGVAVCQAIGPPANQKVDLAVVEAQGIVVKYAPTQTLVILPCIRKPLMDNDEERTAIRKRIFAVNSKLVQ